MKACVYIVTNRKRGVLYIGVTTNLPRRMNEHCDGAVAGFTQKYKLTRLVHVEAFGRIDEAIMREKQLKNWHRDWKINLIEAANPGWDDLAVSVLSDPQLSD